MGSRIGGVVLLLAGLAFISFFSAACHNKKSKEEDKDTPVSGQITITADECFAPLLKDEAVTFSTIYQQAKIKILFRPELDVVDAFFNNPEYRLMIISRRLASDEKKYFTDLGLPAREVKIAIDAIAFVINLQNTDTMLRYDQVMDILSGKISMWNQLDPASKLGEIIVVFDNQRSSTVRYISETVLEGKPLARNSFAVDSNEALVNYIADNPSSIGIIGTSWIRENSDTLKNYFTNRVRVIAVAPRDSSNTYYLPEKRFIYSLEYPFLRELFIVSQEKYAGLGTGFATYMASDEGQRIVQLSGLMPVDKAVRIIELKDKF